MQLFVSQMSSVWLYSCRLQVIDLLWIKNDLIDSYIWVLAIKYKVIIYCAIQTNVADIIIRCQKMSEDTENPLICNIMNLLWALSDKGIYVRFCWVPSHCGIEGNDIVDQLAKEALDHDIDTLTTVHSADLSLPWIPISNRRFKLSGMCLYMVEIFISWNQHLGHPGNSSTWQELRSLS